MDSHLVNLALALSAGTVLVLTLFSGWIKNRFWISEPLMCFAVGVAFGPAGFAVFSLDITQPGHRLWLEEVARLTVALSVMAAALRLPDKFLGHHARSLFMVLVPGMLLMWGASSLLMAPFLGAGMLTLLLIGAVITPTDPVLAGAIVEGKIAQEKVPERLRHAITAESGINDGLALPFVLLPILLLSRPSTEAWTHWLGHVLLWEVAGAAMAGAALGWLAGALFYWAQQRQATERSDVTAVTLALTLTTLALVRLLGADGILAVFTAGVVFFRFVEKDRAPRYEHFQEVVDRFFTLPVFILFGIMLPVNAWLTLGWPLLAATGAVLLLRRLPAWLLLGRFTPFYAHTRETLFAGWFGPIGVAAVFYAALAVHRTDESMVWTVASAVVAASVVIHGVSATPITQRYRDRGGEPNSSP